MKDFDEWLGDLTKTVSGEEPYQPVKKVKVMSKAAEADHDDFITSYEDHGCTCFKAQPCSYCTHPGNPLNLEDDSTDCWEEVREDEVSDRTTYDAFFNLATLSIEDDDGNCIFMKCKGFNLQTSHLCELHDEIMAHQRCPKCMRTETMSKWQSYNLGSIQVVYFCEFCQYSVETEV